jgi:hypothetical protein
MSHPDPQHDPENVRIEDAPDAPTQANPEDVWVVCDCGGNGWHHGLVGSRICEAGCAGAGQRFVGLAGARYSR